MQLIEHDALNQQDVMQSYPSPYHILVGFYSYSRWNYWVVENHFHS